MKKKIKNPLFESGWSNQFVQAILLIDSFLTGKNTKKADLLKATWKMPEGKKGKKGKQVKPFEAHKRKKKRI